MFFRYHHTTFERLIVHPIQKKTVDWVIVMIDSIRFDYFIKKDSFNGKDEWIGIVLKVVDSRSELECTKCVRIFSRNFETIFVLFNYLSYLYFILLIIQIHG